MKRRQVLKAGAGLAAVLAAPGAWAQSGAYPNRVIKILVPYSAGGSPDVMARLIGSKLSQAVGQPVIIDNRPGAGGMMGAEIAAASPADGYNLFFGVKGAMAIAPHLYPNAKTNSLRDFKAVSGLLIVPHIITATPNAPYNTLMELVEYAKRNPGKVDYASSGIGSQPHVALAALAVRLGIKLNHVPYKANMRTDVMSGIVSLYLEASTTAIPSIKAGKIKAFATSGSERIPALPDVPTLTEIRADLDPNGVIGNSWHGIFAPAGTPDDIIARLNAEIVKVVKMPDVQERMIGLGLTPTGTSAATMAATLSSDFAYWGKLIHDLDIKVE
jgi:tripartite-type tricarboxylate transporter receptor subunit TctC